MTERYGIKSINLDLWVDLQPDLAPWTKLRMATIMFGRSGPAASTELVLGESSERMRSDKRLRSLP